MFMHTHKPLRITKGNNSHRNGPSSLLFIIIICPIDMNVYARFDEITSITLEDIKKTKRYGRTDARTDGRTDVRMDEQRENTIPAHKHSLRGYKNFQNVNFERNWSKIGQTYARIE